MAATARQIRKPAAMPNPDKLGETREMVAAQQVCIENLSAGQARIETEVKEMRVENTQQHADNGQALGGINKRLNVMIGGGFLALISALTTLSIYLVQTEGGPWVTKERYTHDMQAVLDGMKRIEAGRR